MRALSLALMVVGGVFFGLALAAYLHGENFYAVRKAQWTCVQPYGAPEHECRQWVRTVQPKATY